MDRNHRVAHAANHRVAVHVKSVSHGYTSDNHLERVIENLDFQIFKGEFLSILGPSGCGKSTLLRLIAALEKPLGGKIDFPSGPLVRGVVFQEPRLLPWRSVLENVKLPLELQGVSSKEAVSLATEALGKVGLLDALNKLPLQLSGGMKMRVSVARSLVWHPSLLLLDEPFSSLDEFSRQNLQNDLRELWETLGETLGMTIIFITHSIQEAVFLSNRAITLSIRPAQILSDIPILLPSRRNGGLRLENPFLLEVKKLTETLIRSPETSRKKFS